MKLSFEKNPDFIRLSNYFKKIEALADKMGVDVDDLIQNERSKKSSMYMSFKKNILAMAQKRVDAVVKRSGKSSSSDDSAVTLTILLNKERE